MGGKMEKLGDEGIRKEGVFKSKKERYLWSRYKDILLSLLELSGCYTSYTKLIFI